MQVRIAAQVPLCTLESVAPLDGPELLLQLNVAKTALVRSTRIFVGCPKRGEQAGILILRLPMLAHPALHDVGDTLGSWNHPEVAAAILRPFGN